MLGAADALGACPDGEIPVHVRAASARTASGERLVCIDFKTGRVYVVWLVWVVVPELLLSEAYFAFLRAHQPQQ